MDTDRNTDNNSHCRFIPWHLPSKVNTSNKLITGSYEVDDPEKEAWFQRWSAGTTGFPWIDAIMRQLREEGWVHHLARHSVACFLTRGGAYISWERGAEVFEELLIDHETACNAGNWQWLSCTAFYAQFYRCYSPVAFGRKWDPEGKFVRRWVPELKVNKCSLLKLCRCGGHTPTNDATGLSSQIHLRTPQSPHPRPEESRRADQRRWQRNFLQRRHEDLPQTHVRLQQATRNLYPRHEERLPCRHVR